MTPRDEPRLPRAVPWLWGVFAAIVLANLAIFFGYFGVMPHAPDFEAARTTRVHLGGSVYVYTTAREAWTHELVQVKGLFVAMAAFFGAFFLSRNVPLERD